MAQYETWLVIRDNKVQIRIPAAHKPTIVGTKLQAKGVRGNDGWIIDGKLADRDGKLAEVTRHVKARRYDKIDQRYIAGPGTSESGLLVITEAEWRERQAAERRDYLAAHPAEAERVEIANLRAEGQRINDAWGDEADTGKGFALIAEADRRLADWRKTYPQAAAAEDAKDLRQQAEHLRELAIGALTYDADGWVSRDEQQERHDKLQAEADRLDSEAAALEQ